MLHISWSRIESVVEEIQVETSWAEIAFALFWLILVRLHPGALHGCGRSVHLLRALGYNSGQLPTYRPHTMINKQFLEDLSQQISRLLPQAEAAGDELKKTVSSALQKGFSSLDLLTREEFDAQATALARAEARLAHLEQEIARLEALLQAPQPQPQPE